jgi:phosphatidylserine/phosphatidylglycerophosphate/cardiolipin synthase-like enzyme
MNPSPPSRRARRRLTAAALIGGLALIAVACSDTKETGAPVADERGGSTDSAAVASIQAQPDGKGTAVLDAIAGAKESVDITIYQLNGPNINAALKQALQRGVDVRVIFNGQWWQEQDGDSSPDQVNAAIAAGDCTAINPSDTSDSSPRQICRAIKDINSVVGAGTGVFAAHWSSNNFNITHQKTVVIDAVDGSGAAIAADQLPATAAAVVLTGNLNSVSYATGGGGYDATTGLCGTVACPPEWNARDFYLTVTDPMIVAEIAAIHASDLACDPPTDTNDLRTTELPLTWSNGSTGANSGDPADQYPAGGNYPYPNNPSGISPDPSVDPGPGTDQGNVRERTLEIIGGAKESVYVYNEEMTDNQTINALAAAAERLGPGKVQVVMTYSSKWAKGLQTLANAGATVRLYEGETPLYIHAKVIMADESIAYVGSTNISPNSINFNRELGLEIQGGDALSTVIETFTSDFAAAPYEGIPPKPRQGGAVGGQASDGQADALALLDPQASAPTWPAPTCGAIPLPTAG